MSFMLTDSTCNENQLEVIQEKAADWMRSYIHVRTAPKYWPQRQSACYCVRKFLKGEQNSAFFKITCLREIRAREDVLFEYSCSWYALKTSQHVRASLLEDIIRSTCLYFTTHTINIVKRRVNREQCVLEMFGEELSFISWSFAKAYAPQCATVTKRADSNINVDNHVVDMCVRVCACV